MPNNDESHNVERESGKETQVEHSFFAQKLNSLRDWIDERFVPLRFSLQLTGAVAAVLVLRRFQFWNPIRNTAASTSKLVDKQQNIRVRCAAVCPLDDTRIVLRCQHVPILRSGFFELDPVLYRGPRLHDFSKLDTELLDFELFGVRCNTLEQTTRVAEMLEELLAQEQPPILKARCLAHSSIRSQTSDVESELPKFPIQATLKGPLFPLKERSGKSAHRLLTQRECAEDELQNAADLGLTFVQRLRLRVFGKILNREGLLPKWMLRLLSEDLGSALVRDGHARTLSSDDIAFEASHLDAGHKLPVDPSVSRHVGSIMRHLEDLQTVSRTCGRGMWRDEHIERRSQQHSKFSAGTLAANVVSRSVSKTQEMMSSARQKAHDFQIKRSQETNPRDTDTTGDDKKPAWRKKLSNSVSAVRSKVPWGQ